MEPLKFSENSWHFRLARFGDSWCRRDISNICAYTRAVITGAFCMLFVIAVVAFITVMAADTLAWVAALVFTGLVSPGPLAFVSLTILAVVIAMAVVMVGIKLISISSGPVSDSFLGASYQSFKHRFCVPVEIEEDSKS